MCISKPLRWKHLELSEKKIKNQQEKKCQKYDLLCKIHSTHTAGQIITLFTQFRPDFFLIFYETKARIFTQLWVARLFILFTKKKHRWSRFSSSNMLHVLLYWSILYYYPHNSQKVQKTKQATKKKINTSDYLRN
jgi:hypothetical protein